MSWAIGGIQIQDFTDFSENLPNIFILGKDAAFVLWDRQVAFAKAVHYISRLLFVTVSCDTFLEMS